MQLLYCILFLGNVMFNIKYSALMHKYPITNHHTVIDGETSLLLNIIFIIILLLIPNQKLIDVTLAN